MNRAATIEDEEPQGSFVVGDGGTYKTDRRHTVCRTPPTGDAGCTVKP